MHNRHAEVDTTIGRLTICAADDAVTGLYFPQHRHLPAAETLGSLTTIADDPLLASAAVQLCEYLDGTRTSFDFPMATFGDPFQEQVWAILREIPFGQTVTYGEIAQELGNKALAQKVGQAVGHNPLSIFIACHRVVGKDGKLTGYAGGLQRKQFLLDLEAPAEVKAARLF
ncbi:methylated-DNA--[protein]-cysteine S-methyltransferase [Rathayibacter soli]|uniref:methylated-DNA--[protein]-cysteine S-methyltransferase n=1 Tax=Rathayibacter soli TaxID=3144168 RepID=UPI0027E4304F|nr:methylated-DNA--[protein]-cysteine S-methyltransferase [Glaciibacter superstes]